MARRGRKKRAETHENHERWLITYADLITLLLVFFVVMYSMSKVDNVKFDSIAQALHMQYSKADSIIPQGLGFLESSGAGQGEDGAKEFKSPSEAERELERKERELQDLIKKIESYVEENNLQDSVYVNDTPRGVAITLHDLFLFDLGRADLKQEAYPALEKLATLFPKLGTTISIEGHTDNIPISTGSVFKNNFGLSQARSLSVVNYFVDVAKLPGSMFISTSYGEHRPVAPNDTVTNRQKNRRVEIIVLREAESNASNEGT